MDRKRKRNSEGRNEAIWTAARCQRILRPIASRIAPLRNLSYITESNKPEKRIGARAGPPSGYAKREQHVSGKSSQDPAWLRRQDARPSIKSYSSKDRVAKQNASSSKPASASKDSMISLPTPFKARALRRHTPNKNAEDVVRSIPCIKIRTKPVKRQKKDPFTFAPVAMQSAEFHDRQTFEKVFELHQGVVDGFSLLLQKTEQREPWQSNKGARSLFSACLRRVPDYIQAEEDWRKSLDPDDETDVAAEVYEELEELGSSSNGWAPLREVVRAHGVKLVNDIIRDRLVSTKTRAELANMPLKHEATQDAERLVMTFAETLSLKRPLKSTSPLFEGCLASLADADYYSNHSDSERTRVRILDSLYSSERLHISWIATKDMTTVLSRAVRSLASQSFSGDIGFISHFLETIITRLLDLRSVRTDATQNKDEDASRSFDVSKPLLQAAQKTINSLLTVLTAMAIIPMKQNDQNANAQQSSSRTAVALLQRLTTSVLRLSHTPSLGHGGDAFQTGARIKLSILTSALVTDIEQDVSFPGTASFAVKDLISYIENISGCEQITCTTTDQLSSFIGDLAQCCGQSLNFNAQDILEGLVRNMTAAAMSRKGQERAFLQQLALESALRFATLTSSRAGKMFANEMEKTMGKCGSLSTMADPVGKNQVQGASKPGCFRWEEGLCEWIAATPLPTRTKRIVPDSDTQISSSLDSTNTIKSPLADHLYDELNSSFDACEELDDSDYMSLHETPQPKQARRQVTAQVLLSSPDVLGEEPMRELISNSLPRRSLETLGQRRRGQHMPNNRYKGTQALALDLHGITHAQVMPASKTKPPLISIEPSKQFDPRLPVKGLSKPEPSKAAQAQSMVPCYKAPAQDLNVKRKLSKLQIEPPVHKTVPSTPTSSSFIKTNDATILNSADIERDELAMSVERKPNMKSRASIGQSRRNESIPREFASTGRRRENTRAAQTVTMDGSDDELA